MRSGRPSAGVECCVPLPSRVPVGGLSERAVRGALQLGEVLAVVVVAVGNGDAVVVAEVVVVVVQRVFVGGAEGVPELFQLYRVGG